MNPVAPGLGPDIDDRVPRSRSRRIEDPVGAGDADAHRIDQDVAVVGRVELALAADRRHADAIAVAADPGNHAGDEMPGARMVRAAEAQRIEDRHRPRAHREHIAQDAADPGRRALIGLDKGWMVVALDLEHDRVAVADIDHPGILARPADHPRPSGRQGLQPHLRGFVRAVLAPHHREDAEFGQVGRAAQDRDRALKLVLRQPMLGGDVRRDVAAAFHDKALARPSKKAVPSVPPSSGSVAFSGCGISPRTVRLALKMPAMARAEPLKFAASSRLPSAAQ